MNEVALPTDDHDGAALLEEGRRLFANECRFIAGITDLANLPPAGAPEVAFAGRSNVGKSSLINALTNRNQLARVSNTPGRTQQINLFDLGGRLVLADLPGYGFAKAPKGAVEAWTGLVRLYLRGRSVLRQTCLLVDARHGLKDIDRTLMGMLGEAAVAYQVVLTKADLVRAGELAERVDAIRTELARKPGAHPEVVPTSAREGRGIAELRAALAVFAETPRP